MLGLLGVCAGRLYFLNLKIRIIFPEHTLTKSFWRKLGNMGLHQFEWLP